MRAALGMVLMGLCSATSAAGPQWTWEAGKQTNNGAITIKSTNGSTTYPGTQNPTGAVAKTNQNAVTQPPTVIIQATGGVGYPEALVVTSSIQTIPACPTGYKSVYAEVSPSAGGWYADTCPVNNVYNMGGTRFSLVKTISGSGYLSPTIQVDGALTNISNSNTNQGGGLGSTCSSNSYGNPWGINVCTK